MPTINDIAQIVNKSPATVSRALNNHSKISKATRDRIHEVARKVGYRPSMVARSLRRGKTMTVGLGISDLMNPYHVLFSRRVEELLSREGYQLLIMEHLVDEQRLDRSVEVMLREGCDGVILNCGPYTDQEVQEFVDCQVSVFAYGMSQEVMALEVDGLNPSHGAITDAFIHLVHQGHRRIKYIHSILSFEDRKQTIRQSVMAHMREAGLSDPSWDPLIESVSDNQMEAGYRAGREILEKHPKTTAVVCTNEFNAVGVWRALTERRIRVPEDLSVVAMDHTWIGSHWPIAMSTIDWNVREAATVAVRTLIRRIEGGPSLERQRFVIPSRFIARASSGLVRRAEKLKV